MKRPVIKISLAIVIIIGIFLALFGLLSRDSMPTLSFNFLRGRELTSCIKADPGRSVYRTTRYVYSFEADFNDVWSKANAELSALGFVTGTFRQDEPRIREYQLRGKRNDELVTVRILDRHKLLVYSTPKSSQYSSPDRHEYHYRYGWVTVDIAQRRLRSWPPQFLLYRLHRMRRRPGNNPRP